MEGTTEEQDKIRRITLFISVLLLVSSVGSYLLYQHFYQSELQVTFISRKILPEETAKKLPKTAGNSTVTKKNIPVSNMSSELQQDPVSQTLDIIDDRPQKAGVPSADPKLFKLSNQIEPLP